MRYLVIVALLCGILGAPPAAMAQAEKKPERVVEKMAVKLVRGVTNVGTAIVELPKQTCLTVREMGGVGYVVGPLKGIGMTLYRGLMGAVETVAFMVPQPGYFDPMVDPEYVWQGWDAPRREPVKEDISLPEPAEKKEP